MRPESPTYPELIIALAISWALGFLIVRLILKRMRPKHLNRLSLVIGLLISPIVMGLLMWLLMWIFSL